MQISVDSIKALRDRTGAGIMDCKRALQSASGDLDQAEELLKQQGIASASKKAARARSSSDRRGASSVRFIASARAAGSICRM